MPTLFGSSGKHGLNDLPSFVMLSYCNTTFFLMHKMILFSGLVDCPDQGLCSSLASLSGWSERLLCSSVLLCLSLWCSTYLLISLSVTTPLKHPALLVSILKEVHFQKAFSCLFIYDLVLSPLYPPPTPQGGGTPGGGGVVVVVVVPRTQQCNNRCNTEYKINYTVQGDQEAQQRAMGSLGILGILPTICSSFITPFSGPPAFPC